MHSSAILSRNEQKQQYVNTSNPAARLTALHYPNSKIHGFQYDYNKNTGNHTTFDILDVLRPYSSYTQLCINWPIYEPTPLSLSVSSITKPVTNNTHDKLKIEYTSLMDFLSNKYTIYLIPDQRKMIDILVNSPPLTFSYLDLELIQLARHYLKSFSLANQTNKPINDRCNPVLLYTLKTNATTLLMTSTRPLMEILLILKHNPALPPEIELYWLTWPEKLLLILLICYNKQLPKTCRSLANRPFSWNDFSVKMSGSFRSLVLGLKIMDSTGNHPSFIPARLSYEKIYWNMFSDVLNYSDLIYRLQTGMEIDPEVGITRKEKLEKFFFLIYSLRLIRNYRMGALPARQQLGFLRTMFANTHIGIEKNGMESMRYLQIKQVKDFLADKNRQTQFTYFYNSVCEINRAFEQGPEEIQCLFLGSHEKAVCFYQELCDMYSYIPKDSWYVNSISSTFNHADNLSHTLPPFIPCIVTHLSQIETEDLLLYNYELDLFYQWRTETMIHTNMNITVQLLIQGQLAIRVKEYFKGIYELLDFEGTPDKYRYTIHNASSLYPECGFLIADVVHQPHTNNTAVLLCGSRMAIYSIQLLSWCQAVSHNPDLTLEMHADGCSLFHVLNGLVHITREPYNSVQYGKPALYHVIIALRVLLLGDRLEKLTANKPELEKIANHAKRVYIFISQFLYNHPDAKRLEINPADVDIRLHWIPEILGNISNFLLTLLLFPFVNEIQATVRSALFIRLNINSMIDLSVYTTEHGYTGAQRKQKKEEAGLAVNKALSDFSLFDPTRVICKDEDLNYTDHEYGKLDPTFREQALTVFQSAIDQTVTIDTRYTMGMLCIQLINAHCPVLPVKRSYLLKLLPSITIPNIEVDIPAVRSLTKILNCESKLGDYSRFTYLRSTESNSIFPHYASHGFINTSNIPTSDGNKYFNSLSVDYCKRMICFASETLIDLCGQRIPNDAAHRLEIERLGKSCLFTPLVHLNGLGFSESFCLPAYYPDGSIVNPVITSLLNSIPNRTHISPRFALYEENSRAMKSLSNNQPFDAKQEYTNYTMRHKDYANLPYLLPNMKNLKRNQSEDNSLIKNNKCSKVVTDIADRIIDFHWDLNGGSLEEVNEEEEEETETQERLDYMTIDASISATPSPDNQLSNPVYPSDEVSDSTMHYITT